ncbi:MAG: GNAT family N-acetyltransferase [Thermoanaerobaculia bacterium]
MPHFSRLFGSVELAARIERAEAGLVAEAVAAAKRRQPRGGAFATPIAGGVAAFVDSGSPVNKLAGLGFAGLPDDGELAAIEADYAARREPVRVELANLAEPSLAQRLTRRGYGLSGFENVLGIQLQRQSVTDTARLAIGVAIAESPIEELDLWVDVVVDGFAQPDAQGVASPDDFPREIVARAMRDFAETSGFERFLARREGQPAGGASFRLADGIAQLCGAATLPAHRRRGIQSSLLAHRLARAAAAGCDVAVATTLPGSKSQENMERHGFRLLYTRAVLVREPPIAGA